MKTFLSVLVAIAMVGGAFVVRASLDRRGAVESGGGGAPVADGPVSLTCVRELEAVCRAIAAADDNVTITVEDAGVTADRLLDPATADTGFDAWLAPAPWPALVEEERRRTALPPLLDAPQTVPLARSPLVIVVQKERALALGPTCSGAVIGWACLGDAARRPWAAVGGQATWGDVKPALGAPATDAIGLLVAGQAVSAHVGGIDFSVRQLDDADPWLANLAAAVAPTPGKTPLDTMLTFGVSRVDAAGATQAEAARLIAGTAREDDFVVVIPQPVATVDIVLVVRRGVALGDTGDAVQSSAADALVQRCWQVEGRPSTCNAPTPAPLPDSDGLPSPGVLQALRDLQ